MQGASGTVIVYDLNDVTLIGQLKPDLVASFAPCYTNQGFVGGLVHPLTSLTHTNVPTSLPPHAPRVPTNPHGCPGALGANTDAGLVPVVQESALALANGLGLDTVAQGKLEGLPRDELSFDCDPKLLVACSATSVVIISSTPALRAFGSDLNGNGDDAVSMTSQSAASLPGADDNASGE